MMYRAHSLRRLPTNRRLLLGVAFFVTIAALVRVSTGQNEQPEKWIVVPIHENYVHAMKKEEFVGVWDGISVDGRAILDLRIGPSHVGTQLTITEAAGTSISSTVYRTTKVGTCDGQFFVGGTDEAIFFQGSAMIKWDSAGWGQGVLTLNDGSSRPRILEFYLFHAVGGEPWISEILGMARRYGLL